MNHKSVFVIALLLLLTLPLTVAGQDKKDSGKDSGKVSITGCLNKGADANHFTIKDDKTGKESTVTGDAAKLTPHANNHNVTITGTMTKEQGKDVVKADDIKMNSVCK
jgi:hypothetical protein